MVKVRFFIDDSTQQPHIHGHDVEEHEVEEVLARPMEDRAGRDGSRVALGQTDYVADPTPGSVFVITAYELGAKALRALRRRQKSSTWKKP